ncbi:MAG: ABC transporter substrate-binding protein [Chloroflexia bacterium]
MEERFEGQARLGRRSFLRPQRAGSRRSGRRGCGGTTNPPVSTQPPSALPTAGSGAVPTAAGQVEPTVAVGIGRATAVTGASTYKEARCSQRLSSGSLPPVEERLPMKPYVVPHAWLKPGKYGGQMRMGGAGTDAMATSGYVHESMYGHSPLRWLKDGLEIGAGLVETWGPNKEQSVWTLKFREGVKWSDGKPFTTADVMYWWDDMVMNEEHPDNPPDEAKSGTGKVMTMKAVDDLTVVLTFDGAAPLTADRIANYVKRGIGPHWIVPKHYMQQFHPKYTKALQGKKDWFEAHDSKLNFAENPANPVLTGWKLKSIRVGQSSVWERNPYYWCVDKAGNQLPYIDGITFTTYADAEVMKLQFQQGKVDYVHGGHTPLALSDIAGLKSTANQSKLEVVLWDSGSGTESLYFFNQDFIEPKMRALIRNAKFRKALSHAYNREEVRKVVYFETGETTTGTYSPKAVEYRFNAEAKQRYQEWRTSALKYDPKLAMSMLDEIGVVDKNGDGLREMPDGSRLIVTIDYPADTGTEHLSKNTLLAKHWKAVGIDARLNPVPPTGYDDQWAAGKLMSKSAWEVGNGPDHLTNPTWLVPIEATRWAPLQGTFFSLRGTPAETQQLDTDPYSRTPPRAAPEKGGPIERLWKLYDQTRTETDPVKRHQLVWQMMKIHVEDGPFFQGTISNSSRIVLVKQGLMNVPRREDLALGGFVNPWSLPSPAVYDPETYYWDNPAEHG